MKPSEIKARITELRKQIAPEMERIERLQEKIAPDLERIEELRQEKSAVVNQYGAKIRTIRQSGKLDEAAMRAFRQTVYAEPDEDKRMDMIDAKIAELEL